MQRNVYKNMSKADARNFNQSLQALKLLSDPPQAHAQFESLCQPLQSMYPAFIQALLSKKHHYLPSFIYPLK